MYSESDLESAIAAGALTPQAADALRRHVAAARAAPAVDEESFRLLTGFNDIFVGIAAVILLVAVAWIGEAVPLSLRTDFDSADAFRESGVSRPPSPAISNDVTKPPGSAQVASRWLTTPLS